MAEQIKDNKNGTYSFIRNGQVLHTGKWGDKYVAPKAINNDVKITPNTKINKPSANISPISQTPLKPNLFDFTSLQSKPTPNIGMAQPTGTFEKPIYQKPKINIPEAKTPSTFQEIVNNPGQFFGDISQNAQNLSTNIKNVGYGDNEANKQKTIGFIQAMIDNGYSKDKINSMLEQGKARGDFQGSWTDNPITGTLSSIASAPIQAYAGLTKGYGDVGEGVLSAKSGEFGLGATQLLKGGLESAMGGLGLATGFNPGGAVVNTAFSSDTVGKPMGQFSNWVGEKTAQGQQAVGLNPQSEASKNIQESAGMVAPLAVLGAGQKYIAPKITPVIKKTFDTVKNIGKINPKVEKAITNKGVEEIYQAVNPTTRENKAQLRNRVEDLLPYIDEKSIFKNDLETVKSRVDVDKTKAFNEMKTYEDTVGVKGNAQTKPIIKNIQDKFIEKTSKGVIIDEATAKIANDLISKLKEFGSVLKDSDIIKVRRSWDKIIEKNKGFMQSAESNIKGDIFNEANKYFRDEIRKSNPEYATYLEKAHKTIALSDILEATIQRRTGQTQGGFLRKAGENTARTIGTGIGALIGGVPGAVVGAGATEALLSGVNKFTGSSAKLAKGKRILLKSKDYGTNNNNISNSVNPNMVAKSKQLTEGPRLITKPKQGKYNTSGKIFNPFSLIGKEKAIVKPKVIENPNKTLIEEAKKYKSAEEFINEQRRLRVKGQRGWSAPGKGDTSLTKVLQGKHNQPSDYFDIKRTDAPELIKTKEAIKEANKTGEITIYRAVPKDINNFRDGEWVYFDKGMADAHGANALSGDYKILSKKVKNDEVFWDGNDINEWGYDTGAGEKQLRQVYEEAKRQGLKIPEVKNIDNDLQALKAEARKLENESEWDKLGKIQKKIFDLENNQFKTTPKPKVIDTNKSNIKEVYHGTNQPFNEFDFELGGQATQGMPSAKGVAFFTENKGEAGAYARNANKNTIPDQKAFDKWAENTQSQIEKLQKQGKWDDADNLQNSFESEYYKKIEDLRNGKVDVSKERIVSRNIDYSKLDTVEINGQATAGKIQEIIANSKKKGFGGVLLKGIQDAPEDFGKTNQIAVWDKKVFNNQSKTISKPLSDVKKLVSPKSNKK